MRILVVTSSFPHIDNSYSGIFIKNTLIELVRLGHNVVVIAPQKFHGHKMKFRTNEEGIDILRPIFFSLGSKNILKANMRKLSHWLFKCSVRNMCKKNNIECDVIYSHFLMPAGAAALMLGEIYNKRVYCSLGESNILGYEADYTSKALSQIYKKFDGLFPNNPSIEKLLLEQYRVSSNVQFIANGVDTTLFYPRDKKVSRRELGLPLDETIVIFVGGFIERKGPDRVLDACKKLKNVPKMLFVGSGPIVLEHEDILFKGVVKNELLPKYLSSADVFVFPTKNEGMPNALLEAMACNLSIVASNIEVNEVVLENYAHSYLCSASNVDEIKGSIELAISQHSSNRIKDYMFDYTLESRAKKIVQFMRK